MSQVILKKKAFSEVQLPPVGKVSIYVDSNDDTAYIVYSNGTRIPIGNSGSSNGLNFYPDMSSFPPTGVVNQIYIDLSTNGLYVWDSTTTSYLPTASNAYVRNKLSTRFDEIITTETFGEALDGILFPYKSPTVVLSSVPTPQIYEKGVVVSSVSLSATTTKKSIDISSLKFYRNNIEINSVVSPSPDGQTAVFNYTTAMTQDSTYKAVVEDGMGVITSNLLLFEFVYPIYYGVGAVGLTNNQIQALSKMIIKQSNFEFVSNTSSQVFYVAYPSSYPELSSIRDNNDNETLGDWTIRLANFTMLDSSVVQYRVYEYKNLTTLSSFKNQFKF